MNRLLVIPLLCLASLAVGDPTASKVYDVTSLLSDPQGKITLLGGKKIQLDQRWSAEKILFEDKMPEANWDHPAAFKVLDRSGKVIEEIAVSRPPLDLESAPVVSP